MSFQDIVVIYLIIGVVVSLLTAIFANDGDDETHISLPQIIAYVIIWPALLYWLIFGGNDEQ